MARSSLTLWLGLGIDAVRVTFEKDGTAVRLDGVTVDLSGMDAATLAGLPAYTSDAVTHAAAVNGHLRVIGNVVSARRLAAVGNYGRHFHGTLGAFMAKTDHALMVSAPSILDIIAAYAVIEEVDAAA